ncbi:MAG: ribose 5-phosphate isomerase B [Candidatus Eremiobacteraeota bacterium]|nr:ribose 5-phosphate isomerase B [Candidatus Eremiobacteraeota bacterium]
MTEKSLIAVGSDHAGYDLKMKVMSFLEEMGYDVIDKGTYSSGGSVDYPDFAKEVAQEVSNGKCRFGILFCGTGMGMAMAANKIKRIRAVTCTDTVSADLARRHNDANILCLGGRITTPLIAMAIVESFLKAEFEGGRHARRVGKITDMEKAD